MDQGRPTSTGLFLELASGLGHGLPLPGSGATWERFQTLAAVASVDLSTGRLVEGHADALAILAEAGRAPVSDDATYGVWASRRAAGGTQARWTADGWQLSGIQEFCSGHSVLDRALLVADGTDGPLLFDVSVPDVVVARHPGSWPSVGMAGSDSGTLTLSGCLSDDDRVGDVGFYAGRPGFWSGAVGVASCWYGGAVGVVDALVAALPADPGPHKEAALGHAVADLSAMHDVLEAAARAIDEEHEVAGSDDTDPEAGRRRALTVRQTVHDRCRDLLDRAFGAGGARPVSHDGVQSQRVADLAVYLAQHHGDADAAVLGRLALEARR